MVRLNPGTIYFVRESEGADNKYSNLVKIGLVEGGRSPFERLKEHQTGNPRRLKFDESQFVETEAVKYVESQLHREYADKRVSGEWFRFSNELEILNAVELAKKLSNEMVDLSKIFKQATDLEFLYSNGQAKGASDEDVQLGVQLSVASIYVDRANSLIEGIRGSLVKVAKREGAEVVEGVLNKIVIEREPAFSTAAFKASSKENKKLHSEFSDSIPKWSSKFEILIGASEDILDAAVLRQLDELEEQFQNAANEHDVLLLSETELVARQIAAPYEWQAARAEAHLKVSCGENAGIEGVCTWVRKVIERKSFNPEKLREVHPNIYEKFVLPRDPEIKYVRLPFKKS